MALIGTRGGCKVGWNYWSTEAEALDDSKKQAAERDRKFGLGYDFGYLWPGSVSQVLASNEEAIQAIRDWSGVQDIEGDVWVVVTV